MRECRPLDGILLLDKPAGMTSNRALQAVKHAWGACKAGHTGSLDPLATGLLPLCFGEGTKISQFLLDADKRYRATLRFGVSTTTYDSEGDVVSERPVGFAEAQLRAVLGQFLGTIAQIPPMYSAIKLGGQPLYKRARAGQTVERAPRWVHIHTLELLRFAGTEAELEVHCSKGTYIRSLVHDLGEQLGCGAHLTALRRLQTGPFLLEQALSLAEAQNLTQPQAALIPLDVALHHIPALALAQTEAERLHQGQTVQLGSTDDIKRVRIYGPDRSFLGLGEVVAGILHARRLRAVKSVEAEERRG